MSEVLPSPVRPQSKRVEFIDLLRGWAVIVMIETHVVNATLMQSLLDSGPFQCFKFLNGLVAPSFLFASGLAYAITTRRKRNDYLSFGPPLFKQVGRLLLILGIGYCLHLPVFSYSKLAEGITDQQWFSFLQVDILQCIAVSLLLLQILLFLLRTERRLYAATASLTVAIIFATPIVWGIDFPNVLPAPVAAYMNGLHYSLFPLFPWSAFLFAGALTGYIYLRGRDADQGSTVNETAVMKRMLWTAPAIILFSFAIEPFAAMLYPTYDYWRFSPSFVLLRMGIVLMLCVGMFFYERMRGVSTGSIVALIGRESLLVYVVHLLLIYGDFGSFNFKNKVGNSFGYLEAGTTTLVLLLLMYGLAVVWSRIKRGSPRVKLAINISALVVFLGVFFFGPGE